MNRASSRLAFCRGDPPVAAQRRVTEVRLHCAGNSNAHVVEEAVAQANAMPAHGKGCIRLRSVLNTERLGVLVCKTDSRYLAHPPLRSRRTEAARHPSANPNDTQQEQERHDPQQ